MRCVFTGVGHLPVQTGRSGDGFPHSSGGGRRDDWCTQRIGIGRSQTEIARPSRRRKCRRRTREKAKVGVQGRTSGARSHLSGRGGTIGARQLAIEKRCHDRRIVLRVGVDRAVAAVNHGTAPSGPRGASRRASRPRWIRDLTVPSETPVMSAISP